MGPIMSEQYVWNLDLEKEVPLKKWMRWCPWINTPRDMPEDFWNGL